MQFLWDAPIGWPTEGKSREIPRESGESPGRTEVPIWAIKCEASQLWGSPDPVGASTKCGVLCLDGGLWCPQWKTSPKTEQKRKVFWIHCKGVVGRGETLTRQGWGATVIGWSEGVWGCLEFSLFLVILQTVPCCNWSVRACGCFEVGHLMRLFAVSSVVALGPFTLIRFPLLSPLPKSCLYNF